MEVKMALTGYGMADKNQVMLMTKALLGLKETPKPDDVADALAIACCCASGSKMAEIRKRAGTSR
jgi:crossover junction endodeoxyribonuclease RuvC